MKGDYMVSEERVAELLEHEGRRNAFIDYVKQEEYRVDRNIIAAMLGFELEEEKGNAKDDCTIGNIKLD